LGKNGISGNPEIGISGIAITSLKDVTIAQEETIPKIRNVTMFGDLD